MWSNHGLTMLALVPVLFGVAHAQDPGGNPKARDLTELSLEDLMNVEVTVTSASRHEQPLSKTPAAIFVLSAEDIRRSGASCIPEALRLVPGVDVARLDSNRWAVSIRGFNGQFANKLLVLVDGRSVYTPLFSGVFWDTLDVPLEDVERIEVIRGPGAALWGANAVNGIINIITKSADQTQGSLLSTTLGDQDNFIGYVRHGGATEDGHWRAWVKFADRGTTIDPSGGDGMDKWNLFHAGVRFDRALTDRDKWMFSGDAYVGGVDNHFDVAAPAPQFSSSGEDHSDVWGASAQSRWTHSFGERNELSLQAYLDHTHRLAAIFSEDRTTAGLDFQRRVPLSERQDLTWGAALRTSYSLTEDTFVLAWSDNHRVDTMVSAFVQDEITLEKDRWTLTAGTKVEHNAFTGFNIQPNLRLLFTPAENVSWWASVSRAVRTPSQAEQDVKFTNAIIPGSPDQVVISNGDRSVDPETLDAFEIGYRVRPSESVSFDATAFYNHYKHLIVYEPGTPFVSGTDVIVPFTATNGPEADSYGLELVTDWTPRANTRISLAWSTQKVQVDPHGSNAPDAQADEGSMPENQVRLRAQHDFSEKLAGDCTLYWVDRLTTFAVPAYWRFDANLGYRPGTNESFSIGVQNLLHNREVEFGGGTFSPSNEMATAVYIRATWSF